MAAFFGESAFLDGGEIHGKTKTTKIKSSKIY
ncbi:hypothetical protein ABID96_001491 [Bacillus sp. OAE603]